MYLIWDNWNTLVNKIAETLSNYLQITANCQQTRRDVGNSREPGKTPGCKLDLPGWKTSYVLKNRFLDFLYVSIRSFFIFFVRLNLNSCLTLSTMTENTPFANDHTNSIQAQRPAVSLLHVCEVMYAISCIREKISVSCYKDKKARWAF